MSNASASYTRLASWSFLVVILCSATASFAADAKNDFNPDVDFTGYRTFAFIGGKELVDTGLLQDPAVRERIENFISGALELRGMLEVPVDEAPGLAVRYWAARRNRKDVTTISTPIATPAPMWGGYPPYWVGPWSYYYEEYVVRNYVEGTIIIDLIDPASRELVWRTFLRQKIEDRVKAYEEAKRKLNRALAVFPPSDREKEKMRRERRKLEAKSRR